MRESVRVWEKYMWVFKFSYVFVYICLHATNNNSATSLLCIEQKHLNTSSSSWIVQYTDKSETVIHTHIHTYQQRIFTKRNSECEEERVSFFSLSSSVLCVCVKTPAHTEKGKYQNETSKKHYYSIETQHDRVDKKI